MTTRSHESFVQNIANAAGCDQVTAVRVADYYLKHKIAKLDACTGQITVKHGVYWERDVLTNAINQSGAR